MDMLFQQALDHSRTEAMRLRRFRPSIDQQNDIYSNALTDMSLTIAKGGSVMDILRIIDVTRDKLMIGMPL